MQKLILSTLSLSALGATLVAQAPPGIMNAGRHVPALGAAELQAGAPTKIITEIGQIELRPYVGGTPGQYYLIATPWDGGQYDLVSGVYDFNGAAGQMPSARFRDDGAVDLLNGSGWEFQGSMSTDHTIVVWDADVGATLGNQPSINVAYLCSRQLGAVNPGTGQAIFQYNNADAVQISGLPAGYVDPHIVGPIGGPGGSYELYIADATGDIGRFSLNLSRADPANPWKVTAAAATYIGPAKANINSNPSGRLPSFLHSPNVSIDGSGNPRALNFSDGTDTQMNTSFVSNGYITPAVDDSEPFWLLADTNVVANSDWFANPSVNGGTVTYAFADTTGVYVDPWQLDLNFVAKTDFTASETLPIYAPIAPTAAGPQYLSVVGFGALAPAPVPIPPVMGNVVIFPQAVTITVFHNTQTGLAELNFGRISGFGNFTMQVVTLDVGRVQIIAGGSANASL